MPCAWSPQSSSSAAFLTLSWVRAPYSVCARARGVSAAAGVWPWGWGPMSPWCQWLKLSWVCEWVCDQQQKWSQPSPHVGEAAWEQGCEWGSKGWAGIQGPALVWEHLCIRDEHERLAMGPGTLFPAVCASVQSSVSAASMGRSCWYQCLGDWEAWAATGHTEQGYPPCMCIGGYIWLQVYSHTYAYTREHTYRFLTSGFQLVETETGAGWGHECSLCLCVCLWSHTNFTYLSVCAAYTHLLPC